MTHYEDSLDIARLAHEHLENAAALFAAISVMKQVGRYDTEITSLARIGREEADLAAQHFNETAQALEAAARGQEVQS